VRSAVRRPEVLPDGERAGTDSHRTQRESCATTELGARVVGQHHPERDHRNEHHAIEKEVFHPSPPYRACRVERRGLNDLSAAPYPPR